jgi:predicted site-specific integrase-resolvase
MPDQFPEIMGVGDVVKYLRVSRQYIDRLARAGKLRYKDTSTGKVFLRSDIESFQETRRQKLRQPKKRRTKLK